MVLEICPSDWFRITSLLCVCLTMCACLSVSMCVCACMTCVGEKVEMTAPVTCLVRPGAGPACESTFTVSFYVPEQHQAAPPKPSDPAVYIEDRKELTVFVR